jgi:hypothetical protein
MRVTPGVKQSASVLYAFWHFPRLPSIFLDLAYNAFLLYFHQHRQRVILTNLISSTSRETGYRPFFLHLFSLTSPNSPSFPPPAFFLAGSRNSS